MANIRIDIASEFKDTGFKKANKATTALDRQFKALGKTLLTVLSARQIVAFGKASVKAFEQDEVAARRLTQTLDNMGLAFEDPRVKSFLSQLEATSGVLDDKLRPAMQALLTTTGSYSKSQELLTLALDVAAGSGQDVVTVVQDLARAYVGNTKGLTKYQLGLTKAELAGKSFSEIQEIISKQFSGQNAAFLETYAGKVSLINVAYANLQETVGKALVDAFSLLSGPNGIAGATDAMNAFGIGAAETIAGTAQLVSDLKTFMDDIASNPLVKFVMQILGPGQNVKRVLDLLRNYGKTTTGTFQVGMSVTGATDYYSQQDAARRKAEQDAAKRAKELAALQKKAEEARKKAAAEAAKKEREREMLRRAGTVFDMQSIQVIAALQGNIDENQRLRLAALLALNVANAEAAEKLGMALMATQSAALQNVGAIVNAKGNVDDLIKQIITVQAQLALTGTAIDGLPKTNPFGSWESVLQSIIDSIGSIPAAPNPFEKWNDIIAGIQARIAAMKNDLASLSGGTGSTGTGTSAKKLSDLLSASQRNYFVNTLSQGLTAAIFQGSLLPEPTLSYEMADTASNLATSIQSMIPNITVNVSGSVISEADLNKQIQNAILQYQKSGQLIIWSPSP
jgi:hypothetical protein